MPVLSGCFGKQTTATTAQADAGAKVRVVPGDQLFVSEPRPGGFGNGPNPGKGSAGWTNENWLKSRFHFNFAEYRDGPDNFGCLRVMNDDLVQPSRGFGEHPHRDMEIITYVVEGSLTHKDSMGTTETLGRGSVQFMTAGRGVRHSEYNLEKDKALRFIQCWVVPRERGLKPNYGSLVGDEAAAEARRNAWAQLAGDAAAGSPTPVAIQQDCNMFVAELEPGKAAPTMDLGRGRQGYLLCVEGSVEAPEGAALERHDGAELKGPMALELTAGAEGALLLLFEMAKTSDARGDI